MFKALAEFSMRGRAQAVIIALLGSWLPLVSQGVLGLVTLRKGWKEGALITLWSTLPVLVGLVLSEASLPLALVTIAVLVVGLASSCVLRTFVSWPYTFASVVVGAVFSSLCIVYLGDDVPGELSRMFSEMFLHTEYQAQDETLAKAMEASLTSWTPLRAAGFFASLIGHAAVIGLLLSRWWQSLLYNPGGFKAEFHALRMPIPLVGLCVLGIIICQLAGGDYKGWWEIFRLPLLFSSLGLMHWLITRYRLGLPAVILLYIALPFLVNVFMVCAVIDSATDLRNKLRASQP